MAHSAHPEQGPSPIPRPADSAARRLHPSNDDAPVLDTGILGEIARGLAEAISEVDPLTTPTVQRVRLLATEGYDAWLMVWGPGANLAAHDHDGSIGVVHVVRGELFETTAELGEPELAPVRRLEAGRTSEFSASHRHAMFNPGDSTVVTIGVYSPPLRGDR